MKNNRVPIIIKDNRFCYIGDNVSFTLDVWSIKSYNNTMLYYCFINDGNRDHIGMLHPFDVNIRDKVLDDILIRLGYEHIIDIL